MARRFTNIYKYTAGEFLFSFFVAFLFFFFIFFVNQILLIAEEILSKNIKISAVLRLLFYSLPAIVSFAFPFGALVGALMAIGRLSSDNEILALQACGIPYSRLFIPIAILGVVFSAGSFIINDIFLPLGTIKFSQLYREILYSNPELELSPYSIKRYQRTTIITGNIHDKEISDIVIIDKTPEKDKRIILADSASLNKLEEQNGVISLYLDNVFIQTFNKQKKNDYNYMSSESMTYNILLRDISFSIRSPGPREMSSRDVKTEVDKKTELLDVKKMKNMQAADRAAVSMEAEYYYQSAIPPPLRSNKFLESSRQDYSSRRLKDISDRSLQIYLVEYYKKFSLPLACFAFVLFAFPVGMFTKRSGRSVGFGIGLLVAVLYWGLLFAGQTFGIQNNSSALLAMWMPDLVIVGAAAVSAFVKFRS
ncbi:MAG: LptF/LptG family permease [Spirochaetales bacterium]|nr:LptF/LptG family permease [Spirochaetales bacterium]